MNEKIDNLLRYFICVFAQNELIGTNFALVLNRKSLNINEHEFKKLVIQFPKDKTDDNPWVNPVDILIMSINSIEKIKKQISLENCNKFTILWIMCLVSAKCISSHDHQNKLSIEFLSNLAGLQLSDYIIFEKTLLKKLDWRVDISNTDYKRLSDVSLGVGLGVRVV